MTREKVLRQAKSIEPGQLMSLEFDEDVDWGWLREWRAQLESETRTKFIVQIGGKRTVHVRLKGSPKTSQS